MSCKVVLYVQCLKIKKLAKNEPQLQWLGLGVAESLFPGALTCVPMCRKKTEMSAKKLQEQSDFMWVMQQQFKVSPTFG